MAGKECLTTDFPGRVSDDELLPMQPGFILWNIFLGDSS